MATIAVKISIHGNNQGISKLYRPQDMGYNPSAGPLKFERETAQSVVVNGNQRPGMVALETAIDKGLAKAKTTGMAICGTYNTCTSTGMLGYYAHKIAKEGFIGIVMAGSPELVAPIGGKQAVFGTNPICVAIPGAKDGPLVLDMATAGITLFGTITAKAAGKPLPPGVAVDRLGRPTTDAAAALEGAFLPFGGYKGAGLSLIVEILTQVLCGGAIPGGEEEGHVGSGRKWREKNWSNTVIAINPALISDPELFQARVVEVLEHVKRSGPGVMLPGEIEIAARNRNLARGTLDVPAGLFDSIRRLAAAKPRL